jgi:DNA-binding PadR family transcriptional regulator
MRDGWIVANMPKEGDLKDYCEITDRGVEYLKLRGDIEPPA